MPRRYTLSLEFTDYTQSVTREDVEKQLAHFIRKLTPNYIEETCVKYTLENSVVSVTQAAREDCLNSMFREIEAFGFEPSEFHGLVEKTMLTPMVECYRPRMSYQKCCEECCYTIDWVEEDLKDLVKVLNIYPEIIWRIQQSYPNAPRRDVKIKFNAYRIVKFICEWADNVVKNGIQSSREHQA